MICDDDHDILEVTAIILEQKGYRVVTYTDCNDIFDKIDEAKPDLILMDLWIPDMGGANVTMLLKSSDKTRNIPVVIFSANNDIAKVAEEVGADGFLKKPFDIKTLEQVIDSNIASKV
jgi:two-component system cell cycle response regulator DivK